MVDVEIDVDGGTGVVEEIGVDGDEAKVSFSLISRVAFLRETIMLNKDWQPERQTPEYTLSCPKALVKVSPIEVKMVFPQAVAQGLRYQSWVPCQIS